MSEERNEMQQKEKATLKSQDKDKKYAKISLVCSQQNSESLKTTVVKMNKVRDVANVPQIIKNVLFEAVESDTVGEKVKNIASSSIE